MDANAKTETFGEKASRFLFGFALIVFFVGCGIVIERRHVFPYQAILSGLKTGRVLLGNIAIKDQGKFQGFSGDARGEVEKNRIHFLAEEKLAEPTLFYGGRHQFREYCPDAGCAAVDYDANGKKRHAYPYRPNEIFKANIADGFPYERAGFSFAEDVWIVGIEQYLNDDLLIVFHNKNAFPYAGGVARVDPQGHPRWFRWDYSHHWPKLIENDIALVPGMRIGSSSVAVEMREKTGRDDGTLYLKCATEKPYHDCINVLNGDGKLLKQIPVLMALLTSPFRAVVQHTSNPCDPTHLNYIDKMPDDFESLEGINAGDFVVSLRNISAFGFIDNENGRFKRLVRGTFFQQHSVQHWKEAKFLIFDNHGADHAAGPSRVLMVDLKTGEERTIFPTPRTPETFRGLFTNWTGKVDISPDRERALVSFSDESQAVEIRLSDGEILNLFNSIHDVSGLEQFSAERKTNAAKFRLYGIDYRREVK